MVPEVVLQIISPGNSNPFSLPLAFGAISVLHLSLPYHCCLWFLVTEACLHHWLTSQDSVSDSSVINQLKGGGLFSACWIQALLIPNYLLITSAYHVSHLKWTECGWWDGHVLLHKDAVAEDVPPSLLFSKGRMQALEIGIILRRTEGQLIESERGNKLYHKMYPNFYHLSMRSLLGSCSWMPILLNCFCQPSFRPAASLAHWTSKNFLEVLVYKGELPFIGPLRLYPCQRGHTLRSYFF